MDDTQNRCHSDAQDIKLIIFQPISSVASIPIQEVILEKLHLMELASELVIISVELHILY